VTSWLFAVSGGFRRRCRRVRPDRWRRGGGAAPARARCADGKDGFFTASASGSHRGRRGRARRARGGAPRGEAERDRRRRAVAELLDHLAHIGTHGGKFALVLVEAAFGDEVGLARTRRGKSLEEDALGVGEGWRA